MTIAMTLEVAVIALIPKILSNASLMTRKCAATPTTSVRVPQSAMLRTHLQIRIGLIHALLHQSHLKTPVELLFPRQKICNADNRT